jgi:PAS domain S-box-containing protein
LSDEYRAAVQGDTPWQRGARNAQPIVISDAMQDACLSTYRQVHAKEGIRAVAFIPLMGNGGLIGKFVLSYNAPHEFQTDELQIAQTIAAHVAFAAERQIAEAALRQSEERFRATFFQAPVGIAHNSLQGEWLLPNDRHCEILGYTRAELRGKTFLDVTHPDDLKANNVALSQCLAGEISTWSMEKRYVRENGATVWARLHVSLVRDQHNLPLYFISVMEDITDRIQAEQALRDSEERLRFALSAEVGVWDCDLRGKTQRFHRNIAEYDLDAVLLDVTLPGMSSWEIFEEAGRIRSDLEVILTSAYGKETVAATFAGLRVEHFIRKPFQLAELVGALQDALSD